MAKKTRKKFTINVYLDDGRVFYYDVDNEESVREHSAAIIKGGYRHATGKKNGYTHYPPHRIDKVKVTGLAVSTKFPDKTRGT